MIVGLYCGGGGFRRVFFFQAEDGIRDLTVTGVQTCALPIFTGTHQGVTGCLACHGPSTGPFAGPPPSNTMTIVGWPGSSHFPIGTADCNEIGRASCRERV